MIIETPSIDEVKQILLDVSRIAMGSGCSSNRVEALLVKMGATWNYDVEVAALPTAVWITIRKDGQQVLELSRVKSWSVDLNKISHLSYLVDKIYSQNIKIEHARRRLKSIDKSPRPYKHWQTFLAGGASSASVMHFYGGSHAEVLLAAPLGLMIQMIQEYAVVNEDRRMIADFVSGAFAALFAVIASRFFPEIDPPRLIVAGIIVLVPGLIFVNAVHEVAQKNLASGSARLLEAGIVGLSLAFGVAFALGIYGILT